MKRLRLKLKKARNGTTFAEVIISFVLISLIVAVSGTGLVSAYMVANKLPELPELYYATQDKVEKEIEYLDGLITERYRIENEIKNNVSYDPSLDERKNEIDGILASDPELEPVTVNLFGKDINNYRFSKQAVNSNGSIEYFASVTNGVRLERLVPILKEVTAYPSGGSSVSPPRVLYGFTGGELSCAVEYEDKNKDLVAGTLFQWYTCEYGNHTVFSRDGNWPEEYFTGLLASYPANFSLIPYAKTETLTVTDDMKGKFLICEATPLSNNGAMGESAVSNVIYIGAFDDTEILSLIDPSMENFSYEGSDEKEISGIETQKVGKGECIDLDWVFGAGMPEISLKGDTTLNGFAGTRYIHFTGGDMMRSSGDLSEIGSASEGEEERDQNSAILIVARDNSGSDADFITVDGYSGSDPYTIGFAGKTETDERCEPTVYDVDGSDWKIISDALPEGISSFEVGGAEVDIAEILILKDPHGSASEASAVQYLKKKYFGL